VSAHIENIAETMIAKNKVNPITVKLYILLILEFIRALTMVVVRRGMIVLTVSLFGFNSTKIKELIRNIARKILFMIDNLKTI